MTVTVFVANDITTATSKNITSSHMTASVFECEANMKLKHALPVQICICDKHINEEKNWLIRTNSSNYTTVESY